jgi:hypothetical protein
MPRPSPSRPSGRRLTLLTALIGVGLGVAVLALTFTTVGPGSRLYWQSTTDVPAGADATHPYAVTFHGATFAMWWPPAPPPNSISTGLTGIELQVTEPSGVVVSTSTGCGSCGGGTQSWYSPDGGVGILYTDGSFGTVTLLVAT